MPEHLLARISDLRQRIRRVLWVYGLSWVLVVVLGAAACVGLIDWLLHLNDAGIRLILALSILSGGAWVAWRCLARPLFTQLTDVEIALQIERRFPEFNDSLASTVDFASRNTDAAIGSPALQQEVIQRSLKQVSQVDVADVVDTRSTRRAACVALLVVAAIAVLAGFRGAEASTAFRRLVLPFSATQWPRTTALRVLDADLQPLGPASSAKMRIARGDSLELYVEDVNGTLPDEVWLQYRREDERPNSIVLRRTTLRDEEGRAREVCVGAIESVAESLKFRAVGGDHRDMPFYWLEVVSPPVLQALQVRLIPPAYTGRGAEELPPGVGHLQGLLGTQVEIRATASKSLTSVKLRRADRDAQELELKAGNRRKFATSFALDEAGVSTYWFEMADAQGFADPRPLRYEVRTLADAVPDVYIEDPASDMLVTPDAEVPLRVVARDDLGLSAVRIRYGFGDALTDADATIVLGPGSDKPQQATIEHTWRLAEMQLTQGTRLIFQGEALDGYDLDESHLGTSVSRTLTVVSPAQKGSEIASRQAALLEELERIYPSQERAHGQVNELQMQVAEVGKLRSQDLDMLKRVELDQRRISSQLLNPVDGVERRTNELIQQLEQNAIEDVQTRLQLERIADELAVLREEHLPAIEHELTQARKTAQSGSADKEPGVPQSEPAGPSLDRAAGHQEQVLASLQDLMGSLTQWHTRNDLQNEAENLAAAQEGLNRSAAELGRQTLTKSVPELTPQQRADLGRVAERQRNYADALQRLQSQISENASAPSGTLPADIETLDAALEQLSDRATLNRMREAAGDLQQNKVGRAAEQQQQILEALRELADILADRAESDLETLVKKMTQAEQKLEELRQRQEELNQLNQPDSGAPGAEMLQKQQSELRDEASRLARQLRRLQARQAGESAGRAAAQMRQAADDLAAGDSTAVDQNQRQALEDLQQAQRELAGARRRAEQQLARELLEKISDEIAGMVDRQQAVIDETLRLDELRTARGNWSRGQLKSLKAVAESQLGLRDEAERLAEVLQSAEVFALAVKGAAREMTTAAARLADRKTDETTIRAERAARQRFVDLMTALEPEDESSQADAQPPAGEPEQPNGPPGEAIPHLAQLKMLRTLQQDLVGRTESLHQAQAESEETSEEVRERLALLAEEQGQIADLARNLTQALMQPVDDQRDEESIPETQPPNQ